MRSLPGVLLASMTLAAQSAGTATMSGVVVDAGTNAPIRHALVELGGQTPDPVQVHTGDDGRFRFDGLVPGQFRAEISAPGFLRTKYAGEQRTGITIRLIRGAVISGRLVNPDGEPVRRVGVILETSTYSPRTGERVLTEAPTLGVDTDDRGMFRLIEIPTGEYVVLATIESQRIIDGPIGGPGVDRVPTATRAEVDAVRRGTSQPGPPQAGLPSSLIRVLKSPTFYPGTVRAADAETITIAAGEERSGVDFAVQYLPARTIRGRINLPGGVTPLRNSVQLVSTTTGEPLWDVGLLNRVAPDGSFMIEDVASGDYILSVQTFLRPADAGERWAATTPVTVGDRDVSDIVLTPSPGITVAGRVQFVGGMPAPEQFKDLRVSLTAVLTRGDVNMTAPPAPVDATGSFKIGGVIPGRYRVELRVQDSPGPTRTWWLKSATINGRDAADDTVDLSGNEVRDALVVVTGEAATISGRVIGESGEPVAGGWVVIFSADPSHWTPWSRRIFTNKHLPTDGTFRSFPLPAGDYLIATARTLEDGEWRDPARLRELSAGAIRVTLAEGEQKVQDLRVLR